MVSRIGDSLSAFSEGGFPLSKGEFGRFNGEKKKKKRRRREEEEKKKRRRRRREERRREEEKKRRQDRQEDKRRRKINDIITDLFLELNEIHYAC